MSNGVTRAHRVQRGEALVHVAARYGISSEYIWNCEENQALREQRAHPNVLKAGDLVQIPAVSPLIARTGKVNRFTAARREYLVVVVMQDRFGLGLGNRAYKAVSPAGEVVDGRTGPDGRIELRLPVRWREVRLSIQGVRQVVKLMIGHLDPENDAEGAKQRLDNLGMSNPLNRYRDSEEQVGSVALPSEEQKAIIGFSLFQKANSLACTGEASSNAASLLRSQHGS